VQQRNYQEQCEAQAARTHNPGLPEPEAGGGLMKIYQETLAELEKNVGEIDEAEGIVRMARHRLAIGGHRRGAIAGRKCQS